MRVIGPGAAIKQVGRGVVACTGDQLHAGLTVSVPWVDPEKCIVELAGASNRYPYGHGEDIFVLLSDGQITLKQSYNDTSDLLVGWQVKEYAGPVKIQRGLFSKAAFNDVFTVSIGTVNPEKSELYISYGAPPNNPKKWAYQVSGDGTQIEFSKPPDSSSYTLDIAWQLVEH
jgi:hypothetical protein